MGEINIPRSEQATLKALDSATLSRVIDQCLSDEYSSALQSFRLNSCGLFVASKLQMFERALSEYRRSKSSKKRSDTYADALRAGSDLLYAVQQMKARVETEEKQAELFYIDDAIRPPFSLTEQLTVKVHYRWRPSVDGTWVDESIEFSHTFDPRPEYLYQQPTRKRSAAQQSRDRQDQLFAEWDELRKQALWSVRDYFQGGRNGAMIPKSFRVRIDAYTRGLNNFSAKFWNE